MNSPLVTISIPIYNCENHIINCLQSVIYQTYKNIEILLVDDLGNDDSMKLADDFINEHSGFNFRILKNEKNSGLSVVRNVGIDNAKGKYIFFLDSDDEITPDCIEKMVILAEKENLQMVCGNTQTIRLETREEVSAFVLKENQQIIRNNDEIFKQFVFGNIPIPSWNKLIEVNFLKENQLFFKEGLFAQDNLQTFITMMKLDSIGFLNDKTYIYYLHPNSVIHNRNIKHYENWNTILSEMNKIYHSINDKERKKWIKIFMVNLKSTMLVMNWKASKNETLWKFSYENFKEVIGLSLFDYFSSFYSVKTQKENFFQNLPTFLGFRLFRKRFGN